MCVCYRHSSEPEFCLWKENLVNTHRVVELQLASAPGEVSDQSCDAELAVNSSVLMSTCTDTCDVDNHPPMTVAQFPSEKTSTEETEAFNQSCAATDDLSMETSNSEGLSRTRSADVESTSVSGKQLSEMDIDPSAGIAELSVVAGKPQNNVQTSDQSAGAEPVESHDSQNLAKTVSGPLDSGTVFPCNTTSSSSQLMVCSLSVDSEAVSSALVQTAVSSATVDADRLQADDNCSLDSHRVDESLLPPENIQPSASEPQMVCDIVE